MILKLKDLKIRELQNSRFKILGFQKLGLKILGFANAGPVNFENI